MRSVVVAVVAVVAVVVAVVALSGCGEKSSYGAVEDALRDHLATAADPDLPSPDAEMDVSVWDPSGEALVVVTEGGEVHEFWMLHDEGGWQVGGRPE